MADDQAAPSEEGPTTPRAIPAEEIDDGDSDSALDMPVESTASLLSDIVKYQVENGRTYHALEAGKYVLPNDAGEQERLDVTHHLYCLTYKGRLCLCPKNDGAKRVLDMGTGTGMWAIDYADMHPEAEVIGVDLSPIQPSFVPPNCTFEIDDLEKDWTWSKTFDFIFCRQLGACFASWPLIIEKAYNHLEPGGWFEIHDNLWPMQCDDGTLSPDSPCVEFGDLIVKGTAKLGRGVDQAASHARWMREAGFADVAVEHFRWPTNRWPRDPHLKELGAWSLQAHDPGLEGLCMAILARAFDWSREEILAFCAQVRAEMRDRRVHSYFKMIVTYGRKPENLPQAGGDNA